MARDFLVYFKNLQSCERLPVKTEVRLTIHRICLSIEAVRWFLLFTFSARFATVIVDFLFRGIKGTPYCPHK